MSGPQAGLCFRRAGPRVLLQQAVRVLAPARALADQLDLGLALPHHHALDERRKRADGLAGDLAQRRTLVAEDAGIAVLIGTDGTGDTELSEHPGEDSQRVVDPRVLRVRLHVLEGGLRPHPRDLELGDEGAEIAGRVPGDRDRPLGREEVEAGEVADVIVAEEDEARQLVSADVLEQRFAPQLQLCRGDARARIHALEPLRQPRGVPNCRLGRADHSNEGWRVRPDWQRMRSARPLRRGRRV